MADFIDELLSPASAVPQEPVSIAPLPEQQDPQKRLQQLEAERQQTVQFAQQYADAYRRSDEMLAKDLANSAEQAATFRKALNYGAELGVSADYALRDPRVIQKLVKEKELRAVEWRARHPQLAEMLADPQFGRAAADDIDALLQDDGWWSRVGNAFTSAYESLEAADIGRKRAFGTDTPYDRLRLQDIERNQRALSQTDGPVQWIAQQLGRMSYQLPSGLAAAGVGSLAGPGGAAVGFFANTFAWTGYEQFGTKFNELKDLNATDEEAAWGASVDALLAGTLEAGFEQITFGLAKPFISKAIGNGIAKALTDQTLQSTKQAFFRGLAKEVGSEVATELGQLIATEAASRVAEFASGDLKDFKAFEDMGEKVTQTLMQTVVVATTFGLLPAGMHAAHVNSVIKQAEKSKAFMDDMASVDAESKTIKEAPSTAENYLRKQAQRTGVETIYVSRDEMRLALEERADAVEYTAGEKTPQVKEEIIGKLLDELDTKIPGIKEQYESAESGETDIEIDIAKYRASGLSGSDLHPILAKYSRFDSTLPSYNKAQEMGAIVENFQQVLRMTAEGFQEQGAPNANAPLAQIREQFADALSKVPDEQFASETGATPDQQRRHLASVAARVYKMLAVRNLEAMPAQQLTKEQREEMKAQGIKPPTPEERLASILKEAGFGEGLLSAEFTPELRVQDGQVAAAQASASLRETKQQLLKNQSQLNVERLGLERLLKFADNSKNLPKSSVEAAAQRIGIIDILLKDVADELQSVERSLQTGETHVMRQERSDRFNKWFGNSKVVDASEKPLIVFHGTKASFSAFAQQLDDTNQRDFFFFTADPNNAETYAGDSGSIMPVYLSLQNPLIIDRRGSVGIDGSPYSWSNIPLTPEEFAKLVSDKDRGDSGFSTDYIAKAAKKAGYDGVIILGVRDSAREKKTGNVADDIYIAFKDTQIKSAIGNAGTFDPTNPDIRASSEGMSARAAYDISRLAVIFTKKTAPKDVMHEIGHFWLRAMLTLVQSGKASPAVQSDVNAILSFLGVKDVAEWAAMTEQQREKFDEKWAYSVEQHFAEGKAPEPALEGIFAKLGKFMRGVFKSIRDLVNPIYKSRFGEDLPALTPEIRRVMDMMLVSEDQIAAAKAQRMISPLFMTRDTFDGTDEEWESLQALREESDEVAAMKFFEELMANTQAADDLRERAEKQLAKQAKAKREELTEREKAELSKERVWRTVALLQRGVMVDEQTGEETAFANGPMLLGIKSVKAALTKAGIDHKSMDLKGLTKNKDGADVSAVAQMLGWNNAVEMLQALDQRGEFMDAVAQRVESAMQNEASLLIDHASKELTVNFAIHNDLRLLFVATELSNVMLAMQLAADSVREDVKTGRAEASKRIQELQPQRDALRKQLLELNKNKAPEAERNAIREKIAALDKELRPLKKLVGGPVTTPKELLQAARLAAVRAVEKATVGQIRPAKGGRRAMLATKHSSMAASASRAATTLMKDAENRISIFRKKQEQLLHEGAAAEAAKAAKEIDQGRRRMDALSKVKRKDLKNYEFDIIYAARLLLGKFTEYRGAEIETGIDEELRKEAISRLVAENPELAGRFAALFTQEERSIESLTLTEFRELQAVLNDLRKTAGMMRKASVLDTKTTAAELQDRLRETVATMPDAQASPGEMTAKEKGNNTFWGTLFLARKFQHWIENNDPTGVWRSIVWNPVVRAARRSRLRSKALVEKFGKSLAALDVEKGQYVSKELNYTFGRDGGSAVHEVLMLLLNTGNASNYDTMLVGKGWADVDENGQVMLDPETGRVMDQRFRMAMRKVLADLKIEKKHFDWVASTWELLQDQFADLQRTHLKAYGYPMKYVEPESRTWTLPDGSQVTLKGGYAPLRYKNVGSTTGVGQEDTTQVITGDVTSVLPTVQNGMTKERVKNFDGDVRLDDMIIFQHLDTISRYIEMQPVLVELNRVFEFHSNSPRSLHKQIAAKRGNPMENMILPWIRDTAMGITTARTSKNETFQRWADRLTTWRRNSAMSSLFSSFGNALQQFTGLSVAMSKLTSKRNMLRALMHTAPDVSKYRNTDFMRLRMDNQMREWEQQLKATRTDYTSYKKLQDWFARNVYWLQTKTQNYVDRYVWDAAFLDYSDRARDPSITEEQWIKQAQDHADFVVGLTQGGQSPEELSTIERGNAYVKIAAQFTGYFNMLVNLNGGEMARILREHGWTGLFRKDLAVQYLWGWFLPIILSEAITKAYFGDFGDEDDDLVAEATDLLLMSQIRSLAASVPAVGQIMPAMVGSFTASPLDDRLRLPPLVDFLANRFQQIPKSAVDVATGDADRYDLTNIFSALTVFTGIPWQALVGRPGGMIYESLNNPDVEVFTPGAQGTERAFELLDAVRYALSGRPSTDQKR